MKFTKYSVKQTKKVDKGTQWAKWSDTCKHGSKQGAQKGAASLVWGDRKFLGGRTSFKDTQPVSQVLILRSAHAWGLMLYGPLLKFLIL